MLSLKGIARQGSHIKGPAVSRHGKSPHLAMLNEIEVYLYIMSTAHRYNISMKRETRKILEYSISQLEHMHVARSILLDLRQDLRLILQIDNAEKDTADVQFRLTLEKVQDHLSRLKNYFKADAETQTGF
jgi:hypothetical protein